MTTQPLGKCDAPRCGSPAEVTSRLGGRYCDGHSYMADTTDLRVESILADGFRDARARDLPHEEEEDDEDD